MRAVLSFGTNTVRVLVVRDALDGTVEQIKHCQIGTRLGEGLRDGGSFAHAAVARTLDAARGFAAVAHDYRATLACIATSAVRRANDRAAFAARVAEVTGSPLVVLSGEEEAAASYRGATYCAPHDGRVIAVLDIGGGSTEYAVGRDGVVLAAQSLELGSVRVSERFPGLLGKSPGAPAQDAAAAARAYVRETLESLRGLGPIAELRCVAGTPLTIAAVIAGSHVDEVSGSTLRREDLEATIARLLVLNLEQRRVLGGMLAQRADIIVGGALVLAEAMSALGFETALLESSDLLLGYLLIDAPKPA